MKYGGMFLFDVYEHVGKWRELNYRGYIEVWKHEERPEIVVLEPYEDAVDEEDVWMAWWSDEHTGNWYPIYIGSYEEAKEKAFEYMRQRQ